MLIFQFHNFLIKVQQIIVLLNFFVDSQTVNVLFKPSDL